MITVETPTLTSINIHISDAAKSAIEKIKELQAQIKSLQVAEVKEENKIHGERVISFSMNGEKFIGYLRGPLKTVAVNESADKDYDIAMKVIKNKDAIKIFS